MLLYLGRKSEQQPKAASGEWRSSSSSGNIPVANIEVIATRDDGFLSSSLTATDGTYKLYDLSTGNYVIKLRTGIRSGASHFS